MTASLDAFPNAQGRPVAIVGGGPIGLLTALALAHYGIPAQVYEEDGRLSLDIKAGTILTRTLEVLRRHGAIDAVLASSLRIDEIGEIDRTTQKRQFPVELHALGEETRFPFVINIPQHDLEPILARELVEHRSVALNLSHKLVGFEDRGDHVALTLDTPEGRKSVECCWLLACDGGRSAVRTALGIEAEGYSLDEKYALVDLKIDLDIESPRDYPYLAYFSDPEQWMILVRHPQCWRFLYPLKPGEEAPSEADLLAKSLSFIGDVDNVEVVNKVVYNVHHRVASRWRSGRVLLMGDAAHLITPMWGLGITTGALDVSNLPWRLNWVLRGWADESLIDGYEREQRPLAIDGSGQVAEAARLYMARRLDGAIAMSENNWANAYTRALLGVKLDPAGRGGGSLFKTTTRPAIEVGDRLPDWPLHCGSGSSLRAHDLCQDRFVALYFSDARRRPNIPPHDSPALAHRVVSRWDAPHDSGLRDRSILDPGDAFMHRLGLAPNTMVLVRPDEHVAAIVPLDAADAELLYCGITGRKPPEFAQA
ncbi:FAD-dependent monooxygenase [Pararobbsia silviterrae]|uniref:FAD-binding monooxygenase n=1 Tax=Pararobbsia silviterrae TaxID=1792498 RepID=A0A494X6T9_9BURK|nr:FAD-dependent monooxygenase [Pararobbsia silviterrae]RKP43914.1 FAD-binding monooxygenase [Pararobbsia silviterrae]